MSKKEKCVKGYVSKIDTPNYDGINAEDLLFDSVSAFRSTIFSTGVDYSISKNVVHPKLLRLSGRFLADSLFTGIIVMFDAKEEGLLKASITGYVASGITSTFDVLVVSRALSLASPCPALSFALSTLATLVISKLANDGLDTAWDRGSQWIADLRYDESSGNVEISTPLYDVKEINTLVAPLMDIQGGKEVPSINNIDVKQTASDGTPLFKLGIAENVYRVARKDTLYKISKKLSVSESELEKANPWLKERYSKDKSYALIRPDEKLKVPSGNYKGLVKIGDVMNEKPASQKKSKGSPTGSAATISKNDEEGHWITTPEGNHVFIEDECILSTCGKIPFNAKGMAYRTDIITSSTGVPSGYYGWSEVYFSNHSPEYWEVQNDPEIIAYKSRNKGNNVNI